MKQKSGFGENTSISRVNVDMDNTFDKVDDNFLTLGKVLTIFNTILSDVKSVFQKILCLWS